MNADSTHDEQQEWHDLLAAATDNTLDAAGWERLRTLARQHPHLMDQLADHLLLDALLREQHQSEALTGCIDMMTSGDGKPPGGRPALRLRARSSRWNLRLAIAASVSLFIAVGTAFLVNRPATVAVPSEEITLGRLDVAVLSRSLDAVWQDGSTRSAGSQLPPGRLQLRSGTVQLDFYSGASVILVGPADFTMESVMGGLLTAGQLRALVPPGAEGFTVRSPAMKVVDLGTEFGLAVDPDGNAEVHVLDGKVEVHPGTAGAPGAPMRELEPGPGLRVSTDGSVQETAATTVLPPDVETMRRQVVERQKTRLEQWRGIQGTLRNDARVLAHFDFTNRAEGQRHVTSVTTAGIQRAMPVGCQPAPSRWPGVFSLGFRQPSDRVRLRLDEPLTALTLAAWVRIDSLRGANSALVMTDRWEHGDVHWQIEASGRLVFDLSHRDPAVRMLMKCRADQAITNDHLGRWLFLAATWDSTSRTACLYRDGVQIARQVLAEALPVTLAKAEIGNWIVPRQTGLSPVRNLVGGIDEVAMFSVALSAEEIAGLYAAGSPD